MNAGYCHVYDPNESPLAFGEITTSSTFSANTPINYLGNYPIYKPTVKSNQLALWDVGNENE
jgi:hypothetical protein